MAAMKTVIAPGSNHMPTCMCGHEMRLRRTDPHQSAEDAEMRRYDCDSCGHEMRVMVFREVA